MQLGLIGLGKMGGNMAERLRRAGHEVVGYDRGPEVTRRRLAGRRWSPRSTAPRVVWVMVPSGEPTRATVARARRGARRRATSSSTAATPATPTTGPNAALLAEKGIGYLDCRRLRRGLGPGPNGYGADGRRRGRATSQRAMPIFDALRPEGPREEGFVHAGPVGAGHFAKMVHNGIEYGLMQAYGEGYELLAAADLVTDVPAVLQAWQRGTVIRSWLLDLLVRALEEDPGLAEIRGYAEDSGEGRWTIEEAIDARRADAGDLRGAVRPVRLPAGVDSPAMKVVAALRHQFGGHAVQPRPARPAVAGEPAGPSRR